MSVTTFPLQPRSRLQRTWMVSSWCPPGSVMSPTRTNVPLSISLPCSSARTRSLSSLHLIVAKMSTLPAAKRRSMMLGMTRGTLPRILALAKSDCSRQSSTSNLSESPCRRSSWKSHSGSTWPSSQLGILITCEPNGTANLTYNASHREIDSSFVDGARTRSQLPLWLI